MIHNKLERILRTIARAYNYPFEWIKEAHFRGLQDINDIIDYCEAKQELKELEELSNETK